jgi:negative regulator of replication initiation
VTLFGETDSDRFRRLLDCEEKNAQGMKKADRDETAKSFIPEDQEVELLKFIKQQEELLATKEKSSSINNLEELKDDEEAPGTP